MAFVFAVSIAVLGGLIGLGSTELRLPLDSRGIILFLTTAAIAAQVGFQGVNMEIEDAARVDGAGGLTLFRHITPPLSRRALAAGLVLSWARALGEFGATILFAGSLSGRTQTMPLLVYKVFERDIDDAIWTGLLLVGIALAALLLSQWLNRKSETDS